jgi:spermidine dehydrogenase
VDNEAEDSAQGLLDRSATHLTVALRPVRIARVEERAYTTPFETYEQQVRDQLQSLLGQHGFDHETDIRAITVNRWPHGYTYWYMMLDDPEWPEGEAPHEIGRAQFGRISIANSASEARPYMDAAIEAGWRAVTEQTMRN